jgi:tetratricopeptide (TPR) repeat protein
MTANQGSFQKAMNLGHSAAWDRKWKQAAGYYRQALDEFPNNTLALTSLGLALLEMKEYDEALGYYIQAIRVSPNDPTPMEKIGHIYELQGKKAEAFQVYSRAAEMLFKGRDVHQAIQTLQKATILKPDYLIGHSHLAFIYEKMGRKQDAALEYVALASLLQRTGDPIKALQAAEHAKELAPGYRPAEHAVRLLQNSQPVPLPLSTNEAISPSIPIETDNILRLESSTETHLDPLAEGRHKALESLAEILFLQADEEDDNTQSSSRRRLGTLERGTGPLEVKPGDRNRIMLLLSQTIEMQSIGKDSQAVEELERAIDIGLDVPAAHFDLALLLYRNNPTKALRSLQKSVLSPDFVLASYLIIGQIHERNKNYSQASSAYLQALRQADLDISPLQYSEALSQAYESIIESQPGHNNNSADMELCENIRCQLLRSDWRTNLLSARQQFATSEDSTPMPLFETLLETGSIQIVDSLARVRKLADQKKYSSAMDEAFDAIVNSPFYLPLHIQIGDILLKQSRIQDAVTKLILVAKLYSLRGEAAQAIRLLNRIIKVAPMEVTVRKRLIDLLVSQKRFDEALEQYLNLASVYYQLAELDAARQTYTESLRLSQKVHTDRSWNVQILYKIADIDMQRLDLRQALRVFEQIRTLEPEDPNARSQLVSLNFRLGQESVALNELDNFITLKENAGNRQQAIDFILSLLDEYSSRLDLRKRLVDLYLRNHQNEKAVEELDGMADTLLTTGRKNEAIAILKSIITLKPINLKGYEEALFKLQNPS